MIAGEKPLVSVIIPTYNRADYLQLTLESVCNQSYKSIEIIVVDDGSPTEYAATICAQYEGVIYIKIPNSGGPATPRNVGIRKAKGSLIAFVDDDDIWLDSKIEKQVAILAENSSFGLVHGCCHLIDENGNSIDGIVGRPGSPEVKHGDVSLRMMGNWTVMMPTPLIRRSVIEEVGFFNEEMPPAQEDIEYWTRCSFYTSFYYLDEPLVEYRKHSENISADPRRYTDLPLHLMQVLNAQLQSDRLNSSQWKSLRNRLLHMQAKSVAYDKGNTLGNLRKIKKDWFLNSNVLKTLLKMWVKGRTKK